MAGPDFIEIGTDDVDAARAFYEAVFGWRFEMGEGGGMATEDTRMVGLHGGDAPSVIPYIAVPDIEAAIDRARAGGGALEGEIADEGPLGKFATCIDPRGAKFGLHQRV